MMPRIAPVNASATPADALPLLAAVTRKVGRVPNFLQTLAHSPAALKSYLAQSESLSVGSLGAPLREQIALLAAGLNRCDYCASAHTLAGKGRGLAADEMTANLAGISHDPKAQAALDFAAQLLTRQGHVTDDALQAVRAAGYGDADIIEIIAHVAMNIFSNYVNHVAKTVIDFPVVSAAPVPN